MFHQYDPVFARFEADDFILVLPSEKAQLSYLLSDKMISTAYYERRLAAKGIRSSYHLAIRRIARSTDERTLIAAILPIVGTDDTASLIVVDGTLPQECALLANMNSLVFDYACSHKIGGTDIRKHNFEQLPILGPSLYTEADLAFVVSRVLELSYFSPSLVQFAQDLGCDQPPFGWDEVRRDVLRSELDVWYFRAYGFNRDELRYILDPADVMGPDYPSETFRVLQKNEIRRYGEFRTRRLVLEAWDRMERGELPAPEPYDQRRSVPTSSASQLTPAVPAASGQGLLQFTPERPR